MAKGPLAIFRKYQKILLVVFGVAIMLVFVVGDSVMRFLGGGRSPQADQNPVVVEWEGEEITERDLSRLRMRHNLVLRFLDEISVAALAGAEENPNTAAYLRYSIALRNRQMLGDDSDRMLVQKIIMANKAKDQGMVVTDQSVRDFLYQVTDGRFGDDGERYEEILRGSGMSQNMNPDALFNWLREELLAMRFQIISRSGLNMRVTPAANWDYFNRLQRTVTAEFAALPVAGYVDEVDDPTEDQQKDHFEKYKDLLPGSLTPGFKRPARVAVQFVEADYRGLVESAATEISEDEIREYYEANKESYVQLDLPEIPETSGNEESTETADESAAESATEGDAEVADESAAESATEGDAEAADESAAESAADGDAESSEDDLLPNSDEPGESDLVLEEGADSEDKETKYRSLDEVRDEIRTSLARPIAQAELNRLLGEIQTQMRSYFEQIGIWQVEQKINPDSLGAKPPKPDLDALAAERGLTANTTDLMDISEFFKDETLTIGQSTQQGQAQQNFASIAFDKGTLPYQPIRTQRLDLEIDFLFWKIEEEDEYTPEFKDAQDEVINALKMEKALDVAKANADELVTQVNKQNVSLNAFFESDPDRQVVLSDPFTWMSGGGLPAGSQQQLRLTSISGVELAGNDFMRSVFALEVGEVCSAVNADESIVYLVRLASEEQPDPVRMERFYNTGTTSEIRQLANFELGDIGRRWSKQVGDEVGIDWKRTPQGPSNSRF